MKTKLTLILIILANLVFAQNRKSFFNEAQLITTGVYYYPEHWDSAQWERDIISERTRDALQFMKKDMKLVGAVPFGYNCNNGLLSPNPDEAVIVEKMIALRKRGKSYQKIAAHLNAKEIPSKNGGKWHPKTVMGVLKAFPDYSSHY